MYHDWQIMFPKLFIDNGLSLDRLRALVEVAAAGGMSLACEGDPVRQSQYSRQIKELEDFFDTGMIERHGRGIRLTAKGRELALISRFFLLGLSNFQTGCSSGSQVCRVGAGALVIEQFLIPAIARVGGDQTRFAVETVADDDIERRLRDLTLDFGIVSAASLGRPLQVKPWKQFRLILWTPKSMARSEAQAEKAFREGRLLCAQPAREGVFRVAPGLIHDEPRMELDGFLQVRAAIETGLVAGLLPDFLECGKGCYWKVNMPLPTDDCRYSLAWNPRLLRLNPRAAKLRDWLLKDMMAIK